jgi:alkylhydroperoxidase/carboxymuconolactone decarboxylase family protein YurZ
MNPTDIQARKAIFVKAKAALKPDATPDQMTAAIWLLAPLSGYRALGMKTMLQRKAQGEPHKWADFAKEV